VIAPFGIEVSLQDKLLDTALQTFYGTHRPSASVYTARSSTAPKVESGVRRRNHLRSCDASDTPSAMRPATLFSTTRGSAAMPSGKGSAPLPFLIGSCLPSERKGQKSGGYGYTLARGRELDAQHAIRSERRGIA
jgi:hypothetical protein